MQYADSSSWTSTHYSEKLNHQPFQLHTQKNSLVSFQISSRARSSLFATTLTALLCRSSAEPGEFSGCHLVEFRPVSQEFVCDLLKRTPPKSCELDSMPTTLMYECMDILLPSLMQIINETLTTDVFPPDFKSAIVKPQLKKQNLDPNNLKNYRLISNLPFLSKLLEKTVLCQLQDHLK